MADRVLRGSRMGAVSYETDRDHDLAPRQMVKYRTEDGDIYEVPFADDAEIPEEWMCKNGQVGTLMEGEGVASAVQHLLQHVDHAQRFTRCRTERHDPHCPRPTHGRTSW